MAKGNEPKCFCCNGPLTKGVHYDECTECPGWCPTCGKCSKHCLRGPNCEAK